MSFAKFSDDPANLKRDIRLLRLSIWSVTTSVGCIQAWASRFWIDGDGSNYLDVATAYLHHDWSHAINGFWSPFLSWLIALCLGIFHISGYWDSTLLHLLNLAALLLSLLSFEFFFHRFLRMHAQLSGSESAEHPLSQLGWWTLGYALFLSTSLLVLTILNTTPDVWVAAFTYFIAGLVVQIALDHGGRHWFALLGLTLGCAYLTKTVYFPLSFVFLFAAWLAAGNPRKTFKQAVLGFLAFLLAAGPWLLALSRAKHRLTFGAAGTVNFIHFYNQTWDPFFWGGENGTGAPKHPMRQLMANPRLFEFATPVGGTYPPSYDASYWMDGVRVRFRLSSLFKVLRQSSGTLFGIWTLQLEYFLAILVLFFALRTKVDWPLLLRKQFHLWLPPLIACLSYAIVLVEPRYVAPFLLLLWVAAFGSLLGQEPRFPRRLAQALVFTALTMTSVRIIKASTSDLLLILKGQENLYWHVAETLHSVGAQPGDTVALLSSSPGAHWARLAGVKIVAEVPAEDENIFWAAGPVEQKKVLQVFASTGARFVVTKDPPICATANGWISLGSAGFYAYRLPPTSQPRTMQ